MKILFLTPWYPNKSNPDYGIFIRNQALALTEMHEVQVVFSTIDYSSFGFCSFKTTESIYGRIKEYRLFIKRSLPVYNQLNYFFITTWYTMKVARQFKPELIHGSISYPGGFWAWLIAFLSRRPFVMTEHTRVIHNFRSPVHRWLSVFSMKRASAILTVSTRMANEITSIIGKPCHVVPNIIVFDNFKDVVPAPPRNVPQIGFLGGLDRPIKGLDILLKGIALIKKDFILHIGGSGKLLGEYKKLAAELGIADRCIFYGTIHHWEVPEFMSQLNFFVSASRFESFGMVILEAVACGLPVVATRCGGPDDFITDENGILVPTENSKKLMEAFEWMMGHYALFDPSKLKKYVAERFSPSVIAQKINAIYVSVLPSLRSN